MALRRIPPILLIGSGACEFAHNHGMTLASNDDMVSTNARDRWEKWTEELQSVNERTKPTDSVLNHPLLRNRDHVAAILTGTYNEGQPDSPVHEAGTPAASPTPPTPSLRRSSGRIIPVRSGSAPARSPSPPPAKRVRLITPAEASTPDKKPASPRLFSLKTSSPNNARLHGNQFDRSEASRSAAYGDKCDEEDSTKADKVEGDLPKEDNKVKDLPEDHPADNLCPSRDRDYAGPGKDRPYDDEDQINDTVGVIAIDNQGRIAAGSSSGGIGMKHRGRVGPAALVGIGTAVIPADEGDTRQMATVAAVTSGTGEHMATAMAAHKCAERLYQGSVRGSDGSDVLDVGDDDEVMASFVQHDFMAHPGVRGGEARPAIGVMAVKKVVNGYYFYFAHNTESFAVASMAATDRAPKVVMSRMPEPTVGATRPLTMRGARKIPL